MVPVQKWSQKCPKVNQKMSSFGQNMHPGRCDPYASEYCNYNHNIFHPCIKANLGSYLYLKVNVFGKNMICTQKLKASCWTLELELKNKQCIKYYHKMFEECRRCWALLNKSRQFSFYTNFVFASEFSPVY